MKLDSSAKPLKSSPEIDKLKELIEIDEAMINAEKKIIESKSSNKKAISDAKALKSRYEKRRRENKAKLEKLLKE